MRVSLQVSGRVWITSELKQFSDLNLFCIRGRCHSNSVFFIHLHMWLRLHLNFHPARASGLNGNALMCVATVVIDEQICGFWYYLPSAKRRRRPFFGHCFQLDGTLAYSLHLPLGTPILLQFDLGFPYTCRTYSSPALIFSMPLQALHHFWLISDSFFTFAPSFQTRSSIETIQKSRISYENSLAANALSFAPLPQFPYIHKHTLF